MPQQMLTQAATPRVATLTQWLARTANAFREGGGGGAREEAAEAQQTATDLQTRLARCSGAPAALRTLSRQELEALEISGQKSLLRSEPPRPAGLFALARLLLRTRRCAAAVATPPLRRLSLLHTPAAAAVLRPRASSPDAPLRCSRLSIACAVHEAIDNRRKMETEALRDALEERMRCVVCLERPKEITFNCGHRMCCECANKVELCPQCRTQIVLRIRSYD